MKQYIRPPSKAPAKDKGERETKKQKAEKEGKDDEAEHIIDIIDDKDLDYSKMENVDTILNKYKNQ